MTEAEGGGHQQDYEAVGGQDLAVQERTAPEWPSGVGLARPVRASGTNAATATRAATSANPGHHHEGRPPAEGIADRGAERHADDVGDADAADDDRERRGPAGPVARSRWRSTIARPKKVPCAAAAAIPRPTISAAKLGASAAGEVRRRGRAPRTPTIAGLRG